MRDLPRRPWFLAVCAALVVLALHVPRLDEPFDSSLAGTNGGRFQGAIQRTWQQGDFFAIGGRPVLRPLPTDPPDGPTYANHPPLFHWVTRVAVRLLGYRERALRLWPVLCAALSGALLTGFATRQLGIVGGLATAGAFATSPMCWYYGRMPNYESPVLALSLAAVLLASRGATASAALLLAIATLHDWAAGFVLAGLPLLRGANRDSAASPRVYRAPVLAVGSAALAYFILLAVWEGGPEPAWGRIIAAAGVAAGPAWTHGTDFLEAQLEHLVFLFGWPGAVTGLVAVPVAAVAALKSRSPVAGQILLWSMVTAINLGLFPARAFNHGFWWYYFSPVVALAAGVVASRSWPRSRLLATLFSIVIIAGALAMVFVFEPRATDEGSENRWKAEFVNSQLHENSLLINLAEPESWYFYCRPWSWDGLRDGSEIESVIERFRDGEFTVRQLVILGEANPGEVYDPLRERYGEDGMVEESLPPYVCFIFRR